MDVAESNWRFPGPRETPTTTNGRQMPPHHEPDAVLINVGQNGGQQPRIPEGGYPGDPGIFGTPRDPTTFGFPGSGPGINIRPNVFIPQGIPQRPDVYGQPRLPGFPDTFGMRGFHIVSRNPSYPSGVYGGSIGPDMFVTAQTPMPTGQNVPGFRLRTGIFVASGDPLHSGEVPVLGQRGVFAVSGNGNVPFPDGPSYFFPERNPNVQGRFPETFIPRPGGAFPGVFYPETPVVPNYPRENSDRNFPGREGAGGREINDEPTADLFPIIDTRPTFFGVPN